MMTEEQAKELRQSIVWGYLCDEIDYRIGTLLNRMKYAHKDELGDLQMEVRQAEKLKNIPAEVINREGIEE